MQRPAIIGVFAGTLVSVSMGCGQADPNAASDAAAPQVVVSDLDGGAWVCGVHRDARSLGKADATLISPDGEMLAVQRGDVLELLPINDRETQSSSIDGATLERARWAPDSQTLAYFGQDGRPKLMLRDGSVEPAVDVELPAGSVQSVYLNPEWSRDSRQVAFITRGLGALVDPADGSSRIFSHAMLDLYGAPWPLAFSADGRVLAGLEDLDGTEDRRIVMVDTETLETREIEGIEHYTLLGWSGDDRAVAVMDVNLGLWLVPRDGGEPEQYGATAAASPVNSEIAVGGAGLRVIDPVTGHKRRLLPKETPVDSVSWTTDGKAIVYTNTSGAGGGYVSAADGTLLLQGRYGVLEDDGWVAMTNPEHPAQSMITKNLWTGAGDVFPMRFPDQDVAGDLVTRRLRWLGQGRFAYLSDDGLHYAHADNSENRVICPYSHSMTFPQDDSLGGRN